MSKKHARVEHWITGPHLVKQSALAKSCCEQTFQLGRRLSEATIAPSIWRDADLASSA
jgi:hypothetical protein